jgi:tetratricopeptide (TPR) repeat protein
MERSYHFLVFIFMFSGSIHAPATNKSDIYQAYINGDMTRWKKVMDTMEQQNGKSNAFIMELINYQYGYIAWCIGNNKVKIAGEYLSLAEKNIKILEKQGYQISMVNAYKSAFYGYRIGLNKTKALFIGPKSMGCAHSAIKQDPENPFGYIQYGNIQYYIPAIFGGSVKVAVEYYLKALKLMESNEEQIKEDWNYLSLMTSIARAYTEMKDFPSAKTVYEKILKIEPRFIWVKDELYPQLLKRI